MTRKGRVHSLKNQDLTDLLINKISQRNPKPKKMTLRQLKEVEDKKTQKAPKSATKQEKVGGTADADDDRMQVESVVPDSSSAANSALNAKYVDELATQNRQGLLDELGQSDIKHT